MSIEKVANSPVGIRLDGLDYEVRCLTIRQKADWSAKIKSLARRAWADRINEVAQAMQDKTERKAFLVESCVKEPDLAADMAALQFGNASVGFCLGMASEGASRKITQEVIEGLEHDCDFDELTRALKVAMGVADVKEDEVSPLAPSPAKPA